MMRAPFILGLALSMPCAAQPVSAAPWMTGQALVELLDGGDVSDIKGPYGHFTQNERIELRRQLARQRGEAYVEGIHDATEGRLWCFGASRPKPSTLQEEVFWGLRALPAAELKRNAADLIVGLWSKKWPCGGKP